MLITIPIVPTAQRRARATVRGRHAAVYKDSKQLANEQTIEAFLMRYVPPRPFEGPVLLGVKAFMPIPQSRPKKWKTAALQGAIRPTTKPDLDNLIKQIKDTMTHMRFWTDDKLIVGFLPGTGKYYSDTPRWEVVLIAHAADVKTNKSACDK